MPAGCDQQGSLLHSEIEGQMDQSLLAPFSQEDREDQDLAAPLPHEPSN